MTQNNWETPQDLFETLNQEFGFQIDLCATAEIAKCKNFISDSENALSKEWNGVCWLNPPYDKSLPHWIRKAYYSANRGATVVCLIKSSSTDTPWWHDYAMKASEIRYFRNRLHFGLNKKFSRANFPSLILVFRPYCKGPPKLSSINTMGEKTHP